MYRDSSGVNIPKFMKDTLLKSAKDRKAVLSYEEQLLNFINNDRYCRSLSSLLESIVVLVRFSDKEKNSWQLMLW